jgi:hypothetical protein
MGLGVLVNVRVKVGMFIQVLFWTLSGNHSTTSVPLVSGVNLWLILERELGVHVH